MVRIVKCQYSAFTSSTRPFSVFSAPYVITRYLRIVLSAFNTTTYVLAIFPMCRAACSAANHLSLYPRPVFFYYAFHPIFKALIIHVFSTRRSIIPYTKSGFLRAGGSGTEETSPLYFTAALYAFSLPDIILYPQNASSPAGAWVITSDTPCCP